MDGKDIEKAFWQSESYASRQYANLIILADGDKVLLFPKSKDGTLIIQNPIPGMKYSLTQMTSLQNCVKQF